MGNLPESRDWGGGGEGGGEWGTVRERETYYSLEVKDVVGEGAFLELRVVLWALLVIFIFFV